MSTLEKTTHLIKALKTYFTVWEETAEEFKIKIPKEYTLRVEHTAKRQEFEALLDDCGADSLKITALYDEVMEYAAPAIAVHQQILGENKVTSHALDALARHFPARDLRDIENLLDIFEHFVNRATHEEALNYFSRNPAEQDKIIQTQNEIRNFFEVAAKIRGDESTRSTQKLYRQVKESGEEFMKWAFEKIGKKKPSFENAEMPEMGGLILMKKLQASFENDGKVVGQQK